MNKCLPLLLALLTLGACSTKVVVKEDIQLKNPDAAWSRVLKTYVDEKGRIDFRALDNKRGDLEEYVAYVAKVSPASHPKKFNSKDAKKAYYINSYNALAMYNVLHYELPEDNDSFFKRLKFFYRTQYKIGGEYISLYDYENDVIRPLGDARIHVALNCMVKGCPRLPQSPFPEKGLNAFLENLAKEFFNEERNVRLDNKNKTVYFTEILDFFTDDFLKEADSLIAYANKYRKTPIPADYEIEFIDYDWTTNFQPGK